MDFEQGPRLRQEIDLAAGELDRKIALGSAGGQILKAIRPDRLRNQGQIAAQDAVLVEARDPVESRFDRLRLRRRSRRAIAGKPRIEPGLEQPDEAARDLGMAAKRVFHIGLAIGQAGLPQHFRIKTQHPDLPDRQVGRKHEPVEAVALGPAGPHSTKRFGEARFDVAGGGALSSRTGEREFVDPDRRPVGPVDAEGFFGDDAQTEMIEHRQHVGQHHRLFGAVEPQPGQAAIRTPMNRDFERRTGKDGVDPGEVGDRLHDLGPRLVGDRQRLEPAQPGARSVLAKGGRRRFGKAVRPGPACLGQLPFERRRIDGRHRAAGRADEEMDARQHRLVEMGVERRQAAGEGALQDLSKAAPQRRVVALARGVDETGDKAFERIAPHEQRDPLPLLKVENADRDVEQLVGVALEQLVARQGVEDVEQGLAVVARRRQPGALEDLADLLPQQRDRPRVAAVGSRGEQPEKEPDADDLAAAAKTAHPDRVHMRPAVHRRAPVRLGDDEQFAASHKSLHVLRQRRQIPQPAEDRKIRIAHDPEGRMLGLCLAGKVVFAVAEEGEVVVLEPAQKFADFGAFGGRHRWRFRAGEGVDQRAQGPPHRRPIGDRDADIGENADQRLREARQFGRVALMGDLDMDPGFGEPGFAPLAQLGEPAVGVPRHGRQRMDHEMHDAVGGIDRPVHRIDKERHIVIGNLDDRMRRGPAVGRGLRVEDPDFRVAGTAPGGKAPQRQGGAAEVARTACGDVGRRNMLAELGDNPLGKAAFGRFERGGGECRGLANELRLLRLVGPWPGQFDRACHPASLEVPNRRAAAIFGATIRETLVLRTPPGKLAKSPTISMSFSTSIKATSPAVPARSAPAVRFRSRRQAISSMDREGPTRSTDPAPCILFAMLATRASLRKNRDVAACPSFETRPKTAAPQVLQTRTSP